MFSRKVFVLEDQFTSPCPRTTSPYLRALNTEFVWNVCVQVAMPVTATAGKPAAFQKTMESDCDEELDSEDLDESDGLVL